MKYSIIIPLYNKENYILKTLKTLSEQLTEEIEIIIIDDCSTDESYNKVCDFLYKHKEKINLKLMQNEKNMGVSETRNKGMNLATGDYLFFLDADDYLEENFLLEVNKILSDKSIDLLCLSRRYKTTQNIEYDYRPLLTKYGIKLKDNLYEVSDYKKILEKKIFLGGSGELLIKRELIGMDKFNTSLSLMEDYDFFFKILKKINKVYFFITPLVVVEDTVKNSLSSKKINYETCDEFLILESAYFIKNNKILKKIFWMLMYSNLNRMKKADRIKLLKREKENIIKYFTINKYSLATLFTLINIDLNCLRKKVKKWRK